jgi:hypothetical protein
MRKYYDIGMNIGAEDLRAPIDPYADADEKPVVGHPSPSWWDQKMYRDKAWSWWDSTSHTTPMLIWIKSNGVKLHTDVFDTDIEAQAAYAKGLSNSADYAYLAIILPREGGANFTHSGQMIADKMFVPVTPIVHETVRVESHAVAKGLGILGAIGLLALAAKAR